MTARPVFVKKARKPNPVVSIKDIEAARSGEDPSAASYWRWKFAFEDFLRYSKEKPRLSQLTKSPFMSQIYGMQEDVAGAMKSGAMSKEDFETLRDDLSAALEDLASECQDSFERMPEQLQDSPPAEILLQRVEFCENAAAQIAEVDYDELDEDDEEVVEGDAMCGALETIHDLLGAAE